MVHQVVQALGQEVVHWVLVGSVVWDQIQDHDPSLDQVQVPFQVLGHAWRDLDPLEGRGDAFLVGSFLVVVAP